MFAMFAIAEAVQEVAGVPWFESLVASGPLAAVLGVAVWKLWTALEKERAAKDAVIANQIEWMKGILKEENDHESKKA